MPNPVAGKADDISRSESSGRGLAEAACLGGVVPYYALLFFDHLHSEYLALKPQIEDQQLIHLMEAIHGRRLQCQLTWSDIYTFDLVMIDVRPLETLIRKAYDVRAKYRSIAGQKEYDEYVASKPPDLTSILIAPKIQALAETAQTKAATEAGPATKAPAAETIPAIETEPAPKIKPAAETNPVTETKPATEAAAEIKPAGETSPSTEATRPVQLAESGDIIRRVLSADIKYLLSKVYLYYAMLPIREGLREDLTSRAVRMTKVILAIIVGLIVASFGGALALDKYFRSDLTAVFSLTVGSVALAGIVGGCVSMLQRIQSTPSEGDALFNLAALTNGWRGLSLSPLYGGIFASLLFVLFAAGVLEGSVFPKINTPGKHLPISQTEQTPTATTAPPSQQAQAPPPVATPTPTPRTQTQRLGILQVTDFLKGTGPTDGVSFALLIVWSFIAGFAERLVPDTLNRLVAKNEALQGTNT